MGGLHRHAVTQQLPQPGGGGVDVLHPVVQVVHLPAPIQLPPDGLGDDAPVVLQYIGLHRLPLLRRLLDGAHVPDAAEGHVQRPGDGRGGQRQRVHLLRPLAQLLLMGHAEALLLVDDEQTQILELHALGQQLVGTDEQIHSARFHPLQHILHLRRCAESGQHLHRHRERPEPGDGRGVVLLCQHGGGYQNGGLFAVQNALHGRPQRHLRLAVAHIAAQQPIHGRRLLHIPLDIPDSGQLVVRLRVVEIILKLPLPRGVRRKGKAGLPLALGVQLDQFLGQILCRRLGPAGGLGPLVAGQLVQLRLFRRLVAAADVFAHQIQRCGRYIQAVAAGVVDLDIVLLHAVHRQTQHPGEPPDAVVDVYHQIAHRQIGVGLYFLPIVRLGGAGLFPAAGQLLGELSLRQHRQLQCRPLAAGAERAHGDAHLPPLRHGAAGQLQRGGDLFPVQQLLHILCPHLAAAQHQHAVPGGEVVYDVGGRRFQTAAVAGQLLGGDVQQQLGRHQIPAGGQALHLAHGEALQRRRRFRLRQCQPPEGACHLTGLHGRRYILLHLPYKGLQRLLHPARLADADKTVLRQIVEGRGRVGVHRRQIPVAAGRRHPLPQGLGVLLQPLPQGGGILLLRQTLCRRVYALGGAFRRIFVVKRQHLAGGQHRKALPVLHTALGGHVEIAHAVQLVVEELAAHRALRAGGEDIQNTAAEGELSCALYLLGADVARCRELRRQRRHVILLPHLQREGGLLQHRRRQTQLRHGRRRRHHHTGLLLCQTVQRPQPPVLPLAAVRRRRPQLPLSGGQHHRLLTGKGAQIGGLPGALLLVGAQHQQGSAALLRRSRRHRGALHGGEPRDHAVLLPACHAHRQLL